MATTFVNYNFRLGMLSVDDNRTITVSFPIFAKDKALSLIVQKCYINGKNGCTSTFIPSKNNTFVLDPHDMKRFSFSFSFADIKVYSDGAYLEIDIVDETDGIIVTVQYVYGRSTGWLLKSVEDSPTVFNPEVLNKNEDGKTDKRSINIAEMGLSVRAYNCLKRAGINTLGDLMDKTMEDMMNVRNLGRRSLEEVLAKMEDYGVGLTENEECENNLFVKENIDHSDNEYVYAPEFEKYNFSCGIPSITDDDKFSIPVYAKDKDLQFVVQKYSFENKENSYRKAIPAYWNELAETTKLDAKDMTTITISRTDIPKYTGKSEMELRLWDQTDEIIITVSYGYLSDTEWYIEKVTDAPASDRESDPLFFMGDDFDIFWSEILNGFLIERVKISAQFSNFLKSKGICSIGDLWTINKDSADKYDSMNEIMERMEEYGYAVAAGNHQFEQTGEADRISSQYNIILYTDKHLLHAETIEKEELIKEDTEEIIAWDNMSSIERIKIKTKLNELGIKKIEGFCCHYCTKADSDDGYILVEQIDVDLAEFIENDFVWGEFQKVVYQEFEFKQHLTGIIYMIFLINKGDTDVPIQKIEGYRKFGRKYVFTEPEAINFISGLNYSFKLDKNFNPMEAWVRQLKPIKLTGIITSAYLSKHVDNYLNGASFEDDSLLDHSKRDSSEVATVAKVDRISTLEMGDFRRFCFGSLRKIEFGDINLFYGANGSGKTSILEALEYGFTAEIHRMKDFKVKYGKDLYPRITVKDPSGVEATFTPSSSKKNSKEIERVWYGVPSGRTKTTLNEQFNRFNYFDSEAAYKFIHSKDQNDEAFEVLFSNLLFGEEIVGYEKKWKRFKQSFEEAYSKIRDELNTAEFWSGIYKDSLMRTDKSIDVTPVFTEAARIHLSNLHNEYTVSVDRLKAIQHDLESITPAVNSFKETVSYEPGINFSVIKQTLKERKSANDQLLGSINQLKDDIGTLTSRKNQLLDTIQNLQGKMKQYGSQIVIYEDAYNKYLVFRLILENPEKVSQLRKYEKELDVVTAEDDLISIISNSASIQFLLSEASIEVLTRTTRTYYEQELQDKKSCLRVLKSDFRKIQEKNDQRKNDTLELQKSGLAFLQKYGAVTCPLCGEEYQSMEELKHHIENAGSEKTENTQLLNDIGALEQEIESLQLIIQKDDNLIHAYEELAGIVPIADAENGADRLKYVRTLLQKTDSVHQRKIELSQLVQQMEQQGITYVKINKAISFAQQNSVYKQFLSEKKQNPSRNFIVRKHRHFRSK